MWTCLFLDEKVRPSVDWTENDRHLCAGKNRLDSKIIKDLFPHKWEQRELNTLAIIRPDQCGAIILLCVHKRTHQLTFKQSLVIISLRGLTFSCFFLCYSISKYQPWYFIRSIQRILQEAFSRFAEIKPKFARYYLPHTRTTSTFFYGRSDLSKCNSNRADTKAEKC